jgi:transcriptional regulator with XRE-family HTH domain
MRQNGDVYFTLLSDALIQRGGKLAPHPSVAQMYGDNGATNSASIHFSNEDRNDDFDARSLLGDRVDQFDARDSSTLLTLPPVALRAGIASAVWVLIRRWGRGNWPLHRFEHRTMPKTLRQVAQGMNIDPGHLSRVARGEGTLSLPTLSRLLRAGGYRIAVMEDNSADRLVELILSGEWVTTARTSFATPLLREAPLPLLVPDKNVTNSRFYDQRERKYLEELDHFIRNAESLADTVSLSQLSRVRNGQRSLSVDMLAAIGMSLRLRFVFIPTPCPSFGVGLERPTSEPSRTATAPPEALQL